MRSKRRRILNAVIGRISAMEKMAAVDVGRLLETLPRSREERWELLKQFFSGWLGALRAADGCRPDSIVAAEQRLGMALPVSLKEWYELAGLRESVWSCQDHFLIPEKLRVEGDRLIICVENQSVVKWGIRVDEMHEDDPPVYVSDQEDEENWIRETPSVNM